MRPLLSGSLIATLLVAAPASAQTAQLPETDVGSSVSPPPAGVDVTLLVVVLVAVLVLADLTFYALRSRRRALTAARARAAGFDEEVAAGAEAGPAEDTAPRPTWWRTPPAGPRERARSRPAPAAMRATVGAAQTRAAPRGARGPRARPR